MRLWTVHPKYLDTKGLLAAWREALLAQKVIRGQTRGYQNHPQLLRFREMPDPLAAIGAFLQALAAEADNRRYHFNTQKINKPRVNIRMTETEGQLHYEWKHLMNKLKARSPAKYQTVKSIKYPEANPIFVIVPGDIREWEKTHNN